MDIIDIRESISLTNEMDVYDAEIRKILAQTAAVKGNFVVPEGNLMMLDTGIKIGQQIEKLIIASKSATSEDQMVQIGQAAAKLLADFRKLYEQLEPPS